MQNRKLYDSLSALTKKSLEIIKNSAEKDLVVIPDSTWEPQDNDTYVMHNIERTLWPIVLGKAKDEIMKTEEFNTFSEVTKSDKIISSQLDKRVGTRMGMKRLEIFDIVLKSISSFLADTEIISFNDSVFKEKYLKIENLLYSKEIEFERITPLCGFFTDTNKIVLDDNLSIVKLSETEIIGLLKLGIKIRHSFGPGNFIHSINQFAIKLTYSLPKIVGDKNIKGSSRAHNPYIKGDQEQAVLNALRLFKEGKVYSLSTLNKSKSVFGSQVTYNIGFPLKSFMTNNFKLIEKEKSNFLEFWKAYRGIEIPENHFLSVAIRRFSQSNERESIEDKIIDFFICAEALFLSSGGNFQGELKYRLSHRAAMFIEDETEKQRIIFKFMQKAYDVRSKIVHGATPKLPQKEDGTDYSLDEFCNKIECLLRFSIKKAIKLAAKAKSLRKILEWNSIIFPI